MPSSRKRDDERKPDANSAGSEEPRPAQTLPAPADFQANENRKRARKRRPKFIL